MKASQFKSPVLSAVAFFGTLCVLSVGYSAYVASYPATASSGATLSSGEWNKMVSGLQTLDTKLSVFNITAGGMVGIGGVTPTVPLVVSGDEEVSATWDPYLILRNTQLNTTGVNLGGVGWTDTQDWPAIAQVYALATENHSASARGTKILFQTTANGTATSVDRMAIDQNGLVGIGTVSPSWQLEVAANAPSSYVSISNNNTAAGGTRWTWLNASTGAPLGAGKMCFENGGICRFNLDGAGNATAATFNGVSDSRLKEHVETVSWLETVSKLRGVEFDWKSGNGKSSGVIAQELEKVLPHLVATDASPEKMKSVNYAGLSAYFIESLKELKSENDRKDRKIEDLEKNLSDLSARLDALEAK